MRVAGRRRTTTIYRVPRRQDLAFAVAVWCAWRTFVALARADAAGALTWTAGAAVSLAAARHWSIRYPAPMPHALRWVLHLSRPAQPTRRLAGVLELKEGERVLEIGPGIGLAAISIAALLGSGSLDVVDVQQSMLDDVVRRATRRGVTNVRPTRCDARSLPFPDSSFDAAYMTGVLGEIPEPEKALSELRRVLKPGGRVAVGEILLDPDFVPFRLLRRRLENAGFRFRERRGCIAYVARFDLPAGGRTSGGRDLSSRPG